MKGTDHFKEVIEGYLKDRSKKDLLFMRTLKKPNKNIDDCIKYILETVKKIGRSGFTDDEIYNMAVHFYDEDDIKPGDLPTGMKIVVNHAIELTEEEKADAKKKAYDQVISEEKARLRKKPGKSIKPSDDKKKDALFGAGTLFGKPDIDEEE